MSAESRLLSGASMEDNSMLCEHTLVMSGDVADSNTVYYRWPRDYHYMLTMMNEWSYDVSQWLDWFLELESCQRSFGSSCFQWFLYLVCRGHARECWMYLQIRIWVKLHRTLWWFELESLIHWIFIPPSSWPTCAAHKCSTVCYWFTGKFKQQSNQFSPSQQTMIDN